VADDLPITAQMFLLHGDAVWRYVRRRVPDSDADDVVSEVFFVLARGKPVPAGDVALPWLYAVAYRVVRKHHTQVGRATRLRQRLHSVHTPTVIPDPADQVSATAWLDDLFGRLTPADAELLRLVVFEDLTVIDAAATLRISVGSAHTRLHRIRRRMQPWLESHHRHPSDDIAGLKGER
jgi:RNA polymerase sigma factor (sigma-70 family)